jgi:hypothetical protein
MENKDGSVALSHLDGAVGRMPQSSAVDLSAAFFAGLLAGFSVAFLGGFAVAALTGFSVAVLAGFSVAVPAGFLVSRLVGFDCFFTLASLPSTWRS